MTLQHGLVKLHDPLPMLRGESFVEMPVIRHLITEWEQEADPVRIPDMKQDIFILFRLEERDAMNLEFTQRAPVELKQQTMQMSTQFVIETRDQLCDLLL